MDCKYTGITARGNRIQISFTYNGERCRETWPKQPTKENLSEANELRQMILSQIKLGIFDYEKLFPNSSRAIKHARNPGDKITIENALNKWLRVHQKRIALSTARDYSSALREHLIPRFGHLYLSELKARDIRDWIASLAISNKRINNVLVPLRAIYGEAMEDELISKNPLARIKNLNVVTREPQPFNDAEIQAIYGELEGNDLNLITFAFETGLRTSELIALQWEDVDLDNKRIYIRRAIVRGQTKQPKTRSGIRTIELSKQAVDALLNQQKLAVKGFVFFDTKTKKELNDKKIRERIWKNALKKAGVQYREPYQTRHTFASRHLSNGKPIIWVSLQMGHSNPNMTTSRYARWIK